MIAPFVRVMISCALPSAELILQCVPSSCVRLAPSARVSKPMSSKESPAAPPLPLQDLILNRKFVDPLLAFSEVCRDELRDLPLRGHTPAPVRERPASGRQGALLRRKPIS